MLSIKKITESKHILIKTSGDSFANASAIYSYILTLHKKVSLYHEEEIEKRLSFLPWFCKLKKIKPSSADFEIDVNAEVLDYFTFFQTNSIKINKKMATALYSGLLMRYDNFNSSETSGTIFATASQLIELGAEQQVAQREITKSDSLALFRLKSILYKTMLLLENAQHVELYISDYDLKSSGASIKDAIGIMKDVLSLAHVVKVTLKKSDENMKIIKTIEEIEFE